MAVIARFVCIGAQALGFGVMVAFVMSARAQDISGIPGYPPTIESYDAREMALLPEYCKHTQLIRDNIPGGSDPVQIQRWRALMGDIFQAMHHYCWGLMKTNRATLLARNATTREHYLSTAIGEFDYVIQRAPREFVLLPEILTKKGENLIRLGRGPVGLLVLEQATDLKPNYWPPYAQMSDYLKGKGELDRAREVLEKGLSQAPDTPALKRRLAELDTRDGKSREPATR